MKVLDSRDRTCLHYAAIKGGTTLINTLFMLNKGNQQVMDRAFIDKDFQDVKMAPKEVNIFAD